jgi:hypothetical protein
MMATVPSGYSEMKCIAQQAYDSVLLAQAYKYIVISDGQFFVTLRGSYWSENMLQFSIRLC